MIVPYSTDAPIYYFPWMTIVLIVANAISFGLTAGGMHSSGWMLTFGHGLHPLEWVAYNFLHFGVAHLVGNMFFLWSFGIVVEGKLGWWKFLCLYMSIGILGGVLIQTAMLWYSEEVVVGAVRPVPNDGWLWNDNSLYAQGIVNDVIGVDDGEVMEDDDEPEQPARKAAPGGRPRNKQAKIEEDQVDESEFESRPGAGGASLVIYGLLAIVLIWAPRNELHFFWMAGFRAGMAEIEYTWFCGFYIATEVLTALLSARGFEATSAIGHATGALIGLGLGTLFVKQDWVDCENWDLFSVMAGKHSSVARVGEWHDLHAVAMSDRNKSINDLDQNSPGEPGVRNAKKKKKKPKLVELESLDDAFDNLDDDGDEIVEAELVEDDPKPASMISRKTDAKHRSSPHPQSARQEPSKKRTPEPNSSDRRKEIDFEFDSSSTGKKPPIVPPPIPLPSRRWFSDSSAEIRQLISDGDLQQAYEEYRRVQMQDKEFRLPEEELELLSSALFKARSVPEAVSLFEEYIERFDRQADRQRVKLAVLYVKYQRKPTAALKTLVKVDRGSLPDDYLAIYRQAATTAQQMISAGITDANV